MREKIESSKAMATAIALCRPQAAYASPATLKTPFGAALGESIEAETAMGGAALAAESACAALSVALEASASGARAYVAIESEHALALAEAVRTAADLGLPIVMTLVGRASGGSAHDDQTDAMALRQSGWIQLFPATGAEAADLHVLAFRLAEELSVPVMVCLEGVLVAEAVEPFDVPAKATVAAFLTPSEQGARLDAKGPIAIGEADSEGACTEARYLQYYWRRIALGLIERLMSEYERLAGRPPRGPLRRHRTDGARILVVAMGAVASAARQAIDLMRAEGAEIGLLTLVVYRPFPSEALSDALADARDVVVIDRAVDVGMGGPLAADVALALAALARPPRLHSAIVGLGGRPVPKASLVELFREAASRPWEGAHFLDLDARVVGRAIHGRGKARRPAPPVEPLAADVEKEPVAREPR